MNSSFMAVVNPAAGQGQCGKLAGPALAKLRASGLELDVVETHSPGHAKHLVTEAHSRGCRRFVSVGGDGTAFEVLNGLFSNGPVAEPSTLAFLPFGTGNCFLRDFSDQGARYAIKAILAGRTRPCDVMRLSHSDGVIHFINMLSFGFTADVARMTIRRFKFLGRPGFVLGTFACLARVHKPVFPLRIDGDSETDNRQCLFLAFNNSKFTGGNMMIAPNAEVGDGLLEFVRWGPIGHFGIMRNLMRIYDGSHLKHPMASRRECRQVDFQLDGPVDLLVDGELLTLRCQKLEVLPAALNVML
jgi:YegS/Rv2252/BmrU family lipid kinase